MTPIDKYMESLPEDQRLALEHLRKLILSVIPGAEETISYQIPTFKVGGKNIVHFAAFKKHMSFFPGGIAEDFAEELAGYKVSKGTIQFTLDKPLPDELVLKIVRVAADRQATKKSF